MLDRLFFAFILAGPFAILLPPSSEAATCKVHVEDLEFGRVDILGFGSLSSAEVSIQCVEVGAASAVTLCGHLGAGSGGSWDGRRLMQAGGRSLAYFLFSDAAFSMPWGGWSDATLGNARRIVIPAFDGSASGRTKLYGAVAGEQLDAIPGTYSSAFAGVDAEFRYAEGDRLRCDAPGEAESATASFKVSAVVPGSLLVTEADGKPSDGTLPISDRTAERNTICASGAANGENHCPQADTSALGQPGFAASAYVGPSWELRSSTFPKP